MKASSFRRRLGFALLETLLSLVVLGMLLVSLLSIALDTCYFIRRVEVDVRAQDEASQGFSRLTEVLRRCGWSTSGGVTYPRVVAGGSELEFRVLRDLDGDGTPLCAATGELEWSPTVYRIRRDLLGNLRIYRGTIPVWHLCRHLRRISFATHREDRSLQLNEVAVCLETRAVSQRGHPLDFAMAGSTEMRN